MIFYILHFTFYIFFALLAFRRIQWAVLFVIATLPSYLIRFRIGPIPTTLLEGMIIIVVLAAVFHRLKKIRTETVPTQNYKTLFSKTFNYPLRAKLALPLGLFLAAATLSLFVAPDLRAAAGAWKAYFIEPFLFFIILLDITIHHPKLLNKKQIIAALSVSALLLSLYAIYQRFTGFGIPPPWDTELRVTSIFPYPNALGLFLAPLIPIFIVQAVQGIHAFSYARKKLRGFLLTTYWILIISASALVIVFAKSTGALAGIAAGLLFMWSLVIFKQRKQKFFILHFSFFILVIVGIVYVLLTVPIIKKEVFLKDWSGHVRRTQWSETIAMLQDRPILGAGLAGYQEILAPYHKATYLEIFEYPHNIVLNFWSEIGLLGLFAFAWLIITFFQNIYRQFVIRHSSFVILGATGAMVAILIHGLVDVPYLKNDLAILFWIVYATGVTINDS